MSNIVRLIFFAKEAEMRHAPQPNKSFIASAALTAPQTQYLLQVRFWLANVTSCGDLPFCGECDSSGPAGQLCTFSVPSWGHGGLDWGSGFPLNGWISDLNFSCVANPNPNLFFFSPFSSTLFIFLSTLFALQSIMDRH
jgi:hypothetical protein